MKPYKRHLFVCLGKRCSGKGSEELFETIKARVKSELKGEIKVSRSGCLSVCKETATEAEHCPVFVVYPEGVWYRNVTKADLDEIFEKHLKNGEVVERLVHYRLPR